MTTDPIHVFAHQAMNTTFEVRIATTDGAYARQAAQECFAEITRAEGRLSRFDEASDIAAINRLAPGELLAVDQDTVECLRLAFHLLHHTGGAFDPTVGQAVDLLKAGSAASAAVEPGDHHARRGRLLVAGDAAVVQVVDGPVRLDLGAIGKGFALDRCVQILDDWDVSRALLTCGGGSTAVALDGPCPGRGWTIGLDQREITLERRAISASGHAVQGQHIVDPRTGRAGNRWCRTWAIGDSGAASDAYSTAWMNLELEAIQAVCASVPGLTGAVLPYEGADLLIVGTPLAENPEDVRPGPGPDASLTPVDGAYGIPRAPHP